MFKIFNHHLTIETDRFIAEWKGFVFYPGFECGDKSIRQFLIDAERDNIEQIAYRLKGHYALSLLDKVSGDQYVFTDEGGHFHIFYADDQIHGSFLELTRELKLNYSNIDPYAVSEFFHWGTLHYNRTFFSSIKKLEGKFVWCKRTNQHAELLLKPKSSLADESHQFDFMQFMESLSSSIRKSKVSVDLTGGIDSRLIISLLLHFEVPFEVAISGIPDHEDVVAAKRISGLIGENLLHTGHDGKVTEDELRNIFLLSDGMMNVLNYHRVGKLQLARKEAGYDLSLAGSGGEIYKEFSWLTDFPFYKKHRTNFERYYDLRFRPTQPRLDYMTEEYANYTRSIRYRVIEEWNSKFLMPLNSETYDNLYYSYKWPIVFGRYATNSADTMPLYAPLLELEAAKYSYHLPRQQRVFNRFHRHLISKYNPPLSKLPSTEGGMSASDKLFDESIDVVRYASNRIKRLLNKSGQRMFNQTWLPSPSPNHPAFIVNVRALPYFTKALEILRKHGIISTSLRANEIQDVYVGRIISLAFFLDQL